MLRSGWGADLSRGCPHAFQNFNDSRGLELVVRGRDVSELGMSGDCATCDKPRSISQLDQRLAGQIANLGSSSR